MGQSENYILSWQSGSMCLSHEELYEVKHKLINVDLRPEIEKFFEVIEEKIQKIRDKLQADSEEIQSLNTERDEVHAKIDRAGEETLSQIYPKIRDYCHGEWAKALEVTEQAWAALQEFEIKQGAKLSVTIHRNGLTPQSMGTDKELRKKFEQWIF